MLSNTKRNPIGLTKREEEILQLIADEYTSKEIAKKLFICKDTVLSHRKKLLYKFNAKNTAGLIVKSIEQNLLNLNSKPV